MVGFLTDMGTAKNNLEYGRKGQSGHMSIKQSLCETVIQIVVQRLRDKNFSLDLCDDVRDHFATLPARYALTVDPTRHDDVLLHMKLLNEARNAHELIRRHNNGPHLLPIVHVRRVALNGAQLQDSDTEDEKEEQEQSFSIPIPKFPKPTFGSNLNLVGLGSGSPSTNLLKNYSKAVSPVLTSSNRNTPPGFYRGTPPSRFSSPGQQGGYNRGKGGATMSLSEMEEESSDSPRSLQSTSYGWEITVASTDSPGLLKFLTCAISSAYLDMNIKEAHAFSTTDGMALEVFVAEGWPSDDVEDLRQAVIRAVHNSDSESERSTPEEKADVSLRSQVEDLAYEDWAVDLSDLKMGAKLGSGSSGRLYRGNYRGQDVAVKVIRIMEGVASTTEHSGTFRNQSASELLQLFKQEVSIMRIVRHKNVVQFIGACSNWPKLLIVTELMAGGSVRDTLTNLGSGLDISSAVRVLRDAARGLDFMHRRGIIHRDVKAANLLIDEHNVVKVCDFGVARMVPTALCQAQKDGEKGNVKLQSMKATEMTAETGTYRWMAPEVLEHKPYNHKADVYSFGITIWEVLTGDLPYNGLSPIQAAIGVVQRGLRPSMPSSCPPRLSALAQSCWRQNPEERPEFPEILSTLDELMNPTSSWQRALFGSRGK